MAQLRVSDFWRPPAQLHSTPDYLINVGLKRTLRQKREVTVQQQPQPEKKKKKAQQAAAVDTCELSASRVGPSRMRLDESCVVAIPCSPRHFCKDFHDDEHELLLVELESGTDTHPSWLEDETVQKVLVRSPSGHFLVSRGDLKVFVARHVPLTRPSRNLSKSLGKMCAPLGSQGPTVVLLQVSKVLENVLGEQLSEEFEEAIKAAQHSTLLPDVA